MFLTKITILILFSNLFTNNTYAMHYVNSLGSILQQVGEYMMITKKSSQTPSNSRKRIPVHCNLGRVSLVGVYAGDTLAFYFDNDPTTECQFRIKDIHVPDPKSTNALEAQAGKELSKVIAALIKADPATVSILADCTKYHDEPPCYFADIYFDDQSLKDILLEQGLGKCNSNTWEPEELREIIRASQKLAS